MDHERRTCCSWCHRLADDRLGEGEICTVCIGLCAFSIVSDSTLAFNLYQHSHWWLEHAFSNECQKPERSLRCWWCQRAGRPIEYAAASEQLSYQDPVLCLVCDNLFIPALPPEPAAIQQTLEGYQQLCLAVTF